MQHNLKEKEKNSEGIFFLVVDICNWPVFIQIKDYLRDTLNVLFKEIPGSRFGFIGFSDYCIDPFLYYLAPTNNIDDILRFFNTVQYPVTEPGPKCYEAALRRLQEEKTENTKIILIGNEVPHEPDFTSRRLDWAKITKKLVDNYNIILPVQLGDNPEARYFYKDLAELGNGKLFQCRHYNLLNALILKLFVAAYHKSFPKENFWKGEIKEGQLLNVKFSMDIKTFKRRHRIKSKVFYQLTRPEIVKKYQEIIIVDKEHGYGTAGGSADKIVKRNGKEFSCKIEPLPKQYVFVEPIANKRILEPNTLVLYKEKEKEKSPAAISQ